MTKAVFLHIGLPKTGTSLLQRAFMHAPDILSQFSVRYLQAGTGIFDDFGHHVMVMAGLGEKGRRIDPGKSPEVIAAAWAAARAEIGSCAERQILISSELFALDVTEVGDMQHIRDSLSADGAHAIKIVLVLRDVVDFVNSVYAQRVRDGYEGSASDYTDLIWDTINWEALVARWAAVFGRENIILVKFEDLDRASMTDSFFKQVFGISYQGHLFDNPQTNRSLPHSAIAFLHELNQTDLPAEKKAEVRNYLHATLGPYDMDMKRVDFLSEDAKTMLRRHCKWPDLPS